MTDEILKTIDRCMLMTSGMPCECSGNLAGKYKQHFIECPNYSQPAWQALRVAYLALDVRSPAIKEIAAILGVKGNE